MSDRSLYRLLMLSTAFCALAVPTAAAQEADADAPVEVEAQEDEDRALDTVVVRGEFIPAPQRSTSQVASFLSAEDLSRQGDSNAALALTRLSGLSVVDDRFAYVRGLGGRYSSALLNGSPLPSPEPLRRTVPLDLFPSEVLEGAAVQKTYSVSYPGEFGGGVIDLKTVRMPRESYANVEIGAGLNTETSLSEGIFYRGSDTDWTGFDDGLRDLPGPISKLISTGTPLSSLSDAEIELAGESLVNSPLTVIQNGELGPDFNASIDGGWSGNFGDFDVGAVGVVGYDQSWETQEATRQFVQSGTIGTELESTETTIDLTTNALGSATIGWDLHEVQATAFYVHSTTKEAQIDTGRDFNAPGSTGEVYDESTGWFERELAFFQLRGLHEFGDFAFNWRGSVAESSRDAPYERSLRRLVDDQGQVRYSVANSYNVRFSELTDENGSFGGDLSYTLPIGPYRDAVFKAGYDYSKTEREYAFQTFRFAGGNSIPLDVQLARPDFLFSPDNISPSRFELVESTSTNDSYRADLEVAAGFLEADVELLDYVRTTIGLRYEEGEENVETFDRFGNVGTGNATIINEYWLPSATLTWNFADDLQLRLGYSETVARPQFRELALSSYFDPETERTYRGNNQLLDSELTNYDARLEYYLGRDEFITVAGFFKEIENPIEEVQFSTSTFVFETTFINSPKAELFGGEFEYRRTFDSPVFTDVDWFAERDWLFSLNYTYTSSEIQAESGTQIFDPITRSLRDASSFGIDGSELQGTPENILNMQFGWQSDVDQFTLLLNWVDERILQRGIDSATAELPDIIEDPGIQLDAVYNRDFVIGDQDFTLGLRARNILGEANEEYQFSEGGLGRTEFNTYDRGTSFSATLKMRF
ncbi:MAG: TonB-dependent receptor [Henriciella sp.]|nr:TonB-dependent receptor [Henriciella sp.]